MIGKLEQKRFDGFLCNVAKRPDCFPGPAGENLGSGEGVHEQNKMKRSYDFSRALFGNHEFVHKDPQKIRQKKK